jgi:hypothetical protein
MSYPKLKHQMTHSLIDLKEKFYSCKKELIVRTTDGFLIICAQTTMISHYGKFGAAVKDDIYKHAAHDNRDEKLSLVAARLDMYPANTVGYSCN